MTTLTGAERAIARCNRPGRTTSGPMAEMMAQAGFSSAAIRRSGDSFANNFLGDGVIGADIMDDGSTRAFIRSFRELARAMDLADMGEQEWTVEVDATDRSMADGAFAVETVVCTVLATSAEGATLAASQLVASTIHPDHMIVATRIIDWP